MKNFPAVKMVEANSLAKQADSCKGCRKLCSDFEAGNWGLARVVSKETLVPPFRACYSYEKTTDVDIYVVDSGIRIEHQEFGGRAVWGFTTPGAAAWDVDNGNDPDRDNTGHGTFVAGIAIGDTFGVAKTARAVAVKVRYGRQTLDFNGIGVKSIVR